MLLVRPLSQWRGRARDGGWIATFNTPPSKNEVSGTMTVLPISFSQMTSNDDWTVHVSSWSGVTSNVAGEALLVEMASNDVVILSVRMRLATIGNTLLTKPRPSELTSSPSFKA